MSRTPRCNRRRFSNCGEVEESGSRTLNAAKREGKDCARPSDGDGGGFAALGCRIAVGREVLARALMGILACDVGKQGTSGCEDQQPQLDPRAQSKVGRGGE